MQANSLIILAIAAALNLLSVMAAQPEPALAEDLKFFEPFFGKWETTIVDQASSEKYRAVAQIRPDLNGRVVFFDVVLEGNPPPWMLHNVYYTKPESKQIAHFSIGTDGRGEGVTRRTPDGFVDISSGFDNKGVFNSGVITWKSTGKDAFELSVSNTTEDGKKVQDPARILYTRLKAGVNAPTAR